MCIAVVCKPGKILTNEKLFRGWTGNPDGAGFAYVKDGKVEIEKGFMKYNDFQKAYTAASDKYAAESPFLVHMRITTSGGTNSYNTHPFRVKGGAMIHNGILFTPTGPQAKGVDNQRKSDTHLMTTVLHNVLVREDVLLAKEAIGKAIGGGNKLCFLYDDAEVVIVNEDAGDWIDGIWYSNSSCEVSRYVR